jgi:uncharacterized protein (DUF2249 family)
LSDPRTPADYTITRERDAMTDTQEASNPARPPEAVSSIPEDRIVDLDVRDDLREGKEPFGRIMEAREKVAPGGALRLRAIFEPAPLYAVLGRQGFLHWTDRRGAEDWVVWFYRPAETEGSEPAAEPGSSDAVGSEGAASEPDGADVVVLDVRGLEPPEPMVRTLAALETLPRGHTLVQINVREPRFLLPRLEEEGFTWEVREQAEDLVRVFIRHAEA